MVYIFPLVQGFNFLNGKHSQTHHLLLESEQFNEEDQILSISLIPWCPLHFLGCCSRQVIQDFLCSTGDKSHTYTYWCAHSLCCHLALAFTNLSVKLPGEVVLVSLCPSSSGHFFPSFGTMVWDIFHSTCPTQSWCKFTCRGPFPKYPALLLPPPGEKAPGPSQPSSPTERNLPGGKARNFAPGDDALHPSFPQLTVTLATGKEPKSNVNLNFHKTECFIFLLPLHDSRSLTILGEQQRLPHSISAGCSLWLFGIMLRLCQGKCQQEPCPDRDLPGSIRMFELKV